MRRLIVSLLIMTGMLLMAGLFTPGYSQSPATSDTPTFYRLVPGTYVNGWPRFTIHYPKEWVERPIKPALGEAIRVSPPDTGGPPSFSVAVLPYPIPLEKHADAQVPVFTGIGATDVTVTGNKPTQLGDGTLAREVEFRMLINRRPITWLGLATKKGDLLINANVGSPPGIVGEHLKAIIYSLEFQPGHDDAVKVPLDVREFLDEHCRASVAHDITQIMAGYSDKYLNSGMRKAEMERFHRQTMGPITSCEISITDFVPEGDRVYLAGYKSLWFGKAPLFETSIIKENSEWKWYGNQRDPTP
jgi:hypothetical protein